MTTPHRLSAAVIGGGFIGRHLIRKLLARGTSIRVLDRNDCPAEFADKVSWTKADYHDGAAMLSVLEGADVAYHLVSSTVPGDQHVDVAQELHDNVIGALRVAQSCIDRSVQRLVFASSASVYGVQEQFPIAESAATWPISAHGIHKLTIEKFLWLSHREHGLDVRIVRLANPYGPGQNLTGRQGFVAIAVGCLLRNEPLVVRDQSVIRDFVYVEDVAEAMARAGLAEAAPRVLNVGSGHGASLSDVLGMVEALSGRKVQLRTAPPRRVDIPVSVLDISLARNQLGFTPAVDLKRGISHTLRAAGIEVVSN